MPFFENRVLNKMLKNSITSGFRYMLLLERIKAILNVDSCVIIIIIKLYFLPNEKIIMIY